MKAGEKSSPGTERLTWKKKTILAPKLNTSERPKLTSKVFNEPLIRPRKEIHFYITLKKKLSGLYSGHKICRLFSKVYLDKPGKFGTIVEIKMDCWC